MGPLGNLNRMRASIKEDYPQAQYFIFKSI